MSIIFQTLGKTLNIHYLFKSLKQPLFLFSLKRRLLRVRYVWWFSCFQRTRYWQNQNWKLLKVSVPDTPVTMAFSLNLETVTHLQCCLTAKTVLTLPSVKILLFSQPSVEISVSTFYPPRLSQVCQLHEVEGGSWGEKGRFVLKSLEAMRKVRTLSQIREQFGCRGGKV